jgi:hypothetical protein
MSLLVIVDESPEANCAVSYVAKLIDRRHGFHISPYASAPTLTA